MGALRILGQTSGSTTITAPATGGDETIELSTALADKLDVSAYTAPGLTLITSESFSAVSSVSVNGCFTSTYENYRVVVEHIGSAQGVIRLRYRASGSDDSTSNYGYALYGIQFGGSVAMIANGSGQNLVNISLGISTNHSAFIADIIRPQKNTVTEYLVTGTASERHFIGSGVFSSASVFDGFSLFPESGTFTGTIRVYGYKD